MSSGDNKLRAFPTAYTADVDIDAVRARLRAERLERRWSLDELANKSGVNRSAIHDIETNREGKPRLETIAKMVEGLGLTLSEFFLQIEALTEPKDGNKNQPARSETPTKAEPDGRSLSSAERSADALVQREFVAALAEEFAGAIDRLVESRAENRPAPRAKTAHRKRAGSAR